MTYRILVKRALPLVLGILVLAGCGSASPQTRLQQRTNDVVNAANAGDAAALRTAAGLLLQEVNAQDATADLAASKAQALRVLTNRVLGEAGLLDQPAPSPDVSPSDAAPTPPPSPTPSPTPTPREPSQQPSAEPAPSSAPPSVVPSIAVTEGGSPSPSSS